jgi:alpha-mannosidase
MPDFTPYTRHHHPHVLRLIRDAIYLPIGELEIQAWRTPEPLPFSQRFSGEALSLQVGESWGKLFDCAWFHFTGKIPPEAAGQSVVLLLDVSGEMCVVDSHGIPVRGLTNAASDYDYSLGEPGKRVLPLTHNAVGGEEIDIWADAGCNDLFGNLKNNGEIKEACIAVCREDIRVLYYDFEILVDSLKVLPETSARYQQILVSLNDAIHLLASGFSTAVVARAREVLSKSLNMQGGEPALSVSAIGHAHIDLGWLWPIRETRRKGARTFSTALANMEHYPDYIFAASQAQLFQWMKDGYPEVYAKVGQRVKDRRWEPQGALWVECDTNVTGGESLVRQLLYGRRFFQDEFNVDVRYVWLPDTFGYSAALPQIMKKAGMKYFSTQKLSWSLINAFPHQSFHWQGIDGSRILVHMLPEETYNSPALPRSLGKIESNYHDKGISDQALMVFGIGDGGGGPGEEHLERLARLKNFAGLSPVKQEWTIDFLERWAKDADRFATWVGELYLERHQGTLTTHGRNKRFNRRIEQALREWEWLASIVEITGGAAYPHDCLEKTWKEVLLYQFHDILPGSSIKRVYDETAIRYQELIEEVEAEISRCQELLVAQVDTRDNSNPAVVFNSLSWERSEWIRVVGTWQKVIVPSLGYSVVDTSQSIPLPPGLRASTDRLENELLYARFDENGTLVSLFDKTTQREMIPAGEKANQLAVYLDLGDAWDFPMDYAECAPRLMELLNVQARIDGPRAVLLQEYQLGHSRLVQEISLCAGSRRLEFNTKASWRETQSMLRVSFPVAVMAGDAAYEIQFGHLKRPTHRNTTWDLARDEVAGQKWVDLSQTDYGVALLNDCKYAHKIKGHTLDLNLIRSVPYPGPKLVKDEDMMPGEPHHGYTDQCEHTFRYALYPHTGSLAASDVIQQAYEFNIPLRVISVDTHAGEFQEKRFAQVSPRNIILETFKKAEDGQGWILRLYESLGASTIAQLCFNFPIKQVTEVNLVEEYLQNVDCPDGTLGLAFLPFEIKTIRIQQS